MNARQLAVFRTFVRYRTLTAAATALHVSQPAVSKVLRHLESQIAMTEVSRSPVEYSRRTEERV